MSGQMTIAFHTADPSKLTKPALLKIVKWIQWCDFLLTRFLHLIVLLFPGI